LESFSQECRDVSNTLECSSQDCRNVSNIFGSIS
jgi:hypothetical protein